MVDINQATIRNTWLTLDEREKLKDKKVMTIGCGGIGWLINSMLFGLGVGLIYAIDDDRIEPLNLNRLIGTSQADLSLYKTEALAKRIDNVRGIPAHFPSEESLTFFPQVDLIVGAVDTVAARLKIQEYVFKFKKTYIDLGAGFKICSNTKKVRKAWGQVIIIRPGWPCLVEHGFDPESDDKGYVCGQSFEELAELLNASSVTINSIISALGAEAALKILLDRELDFNRIDYNHLSYNLRVLWVEKEPNCEFCF